MRWPVVWIFLGFCCGIIAAEDTRTDVPVFIQSFNDLIRRPPIDDDSTLTDSVIRTEWIDQKIDNFDENDARTWKMRYMVNDEFYKQGGPIFIRVGGEWVIKESSISRGHFFDLAKKYNAILFYTEHRFYGKSHPFSDLATENLKYLDIKQALADLAHFVEYQRETNPDLSNAKVIMSGCSYSATMVTWFRRLYPALIDGGWACSGPLLAKVDFPEYKEMVGKSFKTLGGNECFERISNGFRGIEKIWNEKRYSEIKSMFKICDEFDVENDLDMWTFFETITSRFSSVAQYQEGDEVEQECKKLMDYGKDDVNALAKYIISRWTNTIDKYKCVDVTYDSSVTELRNTSIVDNASRSWFYQTCNEYGWYQSSSSKNQPFGTKFPSTLYITMCEDLFGSKYTSTSIAENVANTNEFFGALDPGVTKIYTVHGGLDPWSTMGLPAEKGAFTVPKASHCVVEQSLKSTDSDDVKAAKNQVDALIAKWLKIN